MESRKVYMSKSRRDFIHKDVERSKHQNLPFEIGKPKKAPVRNILIECPECGNVIPVGRNTYMVECGSCRSLLKPKEILDEQKR